MTMSLNPRFIPFAGGRSVNLKTSLMVRIVAVALACLVVAMAVVLVQSRLDQGRLDRKMAGLVARHLEFQRLRIDSEYDLSQRFPDWDSVVNHVTASGQCVRFEDAGGRLVRSHCVGSPISSQDPPGWFSVLYRQLFAPQAPVEQGVSFRGELYGRVLVSSEAAATISRAWQAVTQMLSLTALTVFSLCLLVSFVIDRALAPTRKVVQGLNRLAGGEFSYRLPEFRLFELQRIGEVANQLAEQIETTVAERARLSQRLMNAQEQERRHLARELHDELAQNLTAIAALAASLERSLEGGETGIGGEVRALSQISRNMMTSLRDTLLHLRPADLETFGLVESLRQLINVWSASQGERTRFEMRVSERIGPIPEDSAVHVFRIAQEALTNAAKHAEARSVQLGLRPILMTAQGSSGIELTIEDDGKGRRDPPREPAGDGRGILNMRERVAALDGSIAFEDRPGSGLIVRVRIPLAGPPEVEG